MNASPTPQGEQWSSSFEDLLNQEVPMSNEAVDSATMQQPSSIIGTPAEDVIVWDGQQYYADSCAIRAQEFILERFTGQEFDEHALVQEAAKRGWVLPNGGGTPLLDVGNVLELYGIFVNRYEQANMFHVANELAQGHKVIIAVDKDELWNINASLENIQQIAGTDPGADHAIVVSGIDTSDLNNIQVIVSDPGTGEAAIRYPLSQFIDAWEDSNFYMVATQEPAPQWLPEMVNFPYDQGHIPEIAKMPYEEFVTLEDQPEAWVDLFDATQPTDLYTDNDEQAFSPVRPGQPGFDNLNLETDATMDNDQAQSLPDVDQEPSPEEPEI